ncbi:MAG: hypothetical protein JWM80_4109, partial [Cyanobacteria bacterium RYN_339]|nr:hypothetical protein [Cyanobacteria bacterium RYN_339]
AAFAQEMADVHPEKPRATADPAAPIDGLLAKGDLAGAQRLLPNTADDAMSHVRRGRFYDAAGKDKRALEELEGAVAAGGSKIVRAAALTALGNAKLRQGDHAGAKAAAEAALALNWTNNDAYRLAAEVARRDERWQDVITILDKHLHQVEDADLEMRLFEAHKALDHKGWAGEWLDAGALHAGDDPHAKIRVGLSRPYDRGLSMAADAYRAALAAGQNDLELHLLGAETAARRKDPAGLKAAVDAAAATGAKDARVWYWQGRAADARNDSELADAMYTQAKARDPHFDPVALAYLKSRR